MSLQSDVMAEKRRDVKNNSSKKLLIDIGGAAIFGALSIVLSQLTTASLPRMGWGIAIFDPVSLIWIMAFLIFGFRCGVLTSIVGALGLMPFDPTPFAGPVMKFASTIMIILVLHLYAKISYKNQLNFEKMGSLRTYIPAALIAWVIRSLIMVFLNYLYIVYFYEMPLEALDLEWLGNKDISGFTAIFITVFLLNTIQSALDLIIPYLLVYSGKFALNHFLKNQM